MGYIRHHAIVVTSWNKRLLRKARKAAKECGNGVSLITRSQYQGYETFIVAPDGSKEGWGESESGDMRRECFKAWLNLNRYNDGSSSLEWFEIAYGTDTEIAPQVIEHSNNPFTGIDSTP